LEEIIREMGRTEAEVELTPQEVELTVKDAVKAAVQEAVRDALELSMVHEEQEVETPVL
jgi:hypothetical protein